MKKNVILIAVGEKPDLVPSKHFRAAGIRFIFNENDIAIYENLKREKPNLIVEAEIEKISDRQVVDSSTRFGYFVMASDDRDEIRNAFI